jgi:hypothetical protein
MQDSPGTQTSSPQEPGGVVLFAGVVLLPGVVLLDAVLFVVLFSSPLLAGRVDTSVSAQPAAATTASKAMVYFQNFTVTSYARMAPSSQTSLVCEPRRLSNDVSPPEW